ncbi:hypothetical protein GCM10023093_23220 [Nemorincola caseinilytica]|uniref:Uncharacterized protein n=1 Tax=Nemorincola caseinilytica TaxID=2054315 RepID=A0ABP8NHD2_9BACT
MRKLLLICCLCIAAGARGQVSEEAVKPLIKQRLYSCFEVEYNAVIEVQRLYREGKTDTMDALIGFWQRHCQMTERVFSIGLLNSIRKGDFNEYISSNNFLMPRERPVAIDSDVYRPGILAMLNDYKAAGKGSIFDRSYTAWEKNNYAYPKNVTEFYDFYERYYNFLREMARDLQGKRKYTPVEDFLLRYYADPKGVSYAELDSVLYNGSILYDVYHDYKKYDKSIQGYSYGMTAGIWVPTDKLALLGNHPSFGFNMGGKTYKTAWDMVVGFRTNRAANTYMVYTEDSLYSTNYFFGAYLGMDVTHTLWQRGKHQLDLLWGIGYEGIQTLNEIDETRKGSSTIDHYLNIWYVNPGVGYKLYVRNKVRGETRKFSYLALQGRYYITDIRNRGGTDLHGNYCTIGLVYGAYSHTYSKYPHLK